MVTSARLPCLPGIRAQRGFTYLWLLAAIALLGIGLLSISEVWVQSARRQKLLELEWIGKQFTSAIGSYYHSTPGPVKSYPKALQDLIEDKRYITVRRHLRTIYADPFTRKQDWELIIAADGGIIGVKVLIPGDPKNGFRQFFYQPGVTEP